jgi:hypothetical protein
MNEEEFWTLIEETKAQAENDDELQQQLITERLMQLPPQAISDFDDLFTLKTNQAYDHKLWAAADIIDGGCSDDCFMDFRGWLIAQGRQVYEKALADPDSLAELELIDGEYWEGYRYCTTDAYRAVTGEEDMPYDATSPSFAARIHPDEPTGERWEDEELNELLPRLYKKYYPSAT